MGGVRRDGGQDQYCAVFVSRGCRLVSGYSLLPLPSPPTLSRIVDHKTARVRARRAGDGELERPLIIVCDAIRQQLMNLQ